MGTQPRFPQQAILSREYGAGVHPHFLEDLWLGHWAALGYAWAWIWQLEERRGGGAQRQSFLRGVLLQYAIGHRSLDWVRSPVFEFQICLRLCDQGQVISLLWACFFIWRMEIKHVSHRAFVKIKWIMKANIDRA